MFVCVSVCGLNTSSQGGCCDIAINGHIHAIRLHFLKVTLLLLATGVGLDDCYDHHHVWRDWRVADTVLSTCPTIVRAPESADVSISTVQIKKLRL